MNCLGNRLYLALFLHTNCKIVNWLNQCFIFSYNALHVVQCSIVREVEILFVNVVYCDHNSVYFSLKWCYVTFVHMHVCYM